MQFHTRQRRLSILIIWSEVFLSVDRNGFIDWRSICLFFCLQMFSVDLTEPHYSWRKVTDTNGTTPSPRNKHSCWVHRDRSAPPLSSTSCAFPLSKVLDSYPEPESPHLPHSIIAQIKLFSAFQELNCLGMCCRDPGLNSDLWPFEFSQMYFSVIPNVNWRTPVCFCRCRLIYFGGYGCKTMGEVQNTSSTSFIVEEMSWVNNNEETF